MTLCPHCSGEGCAQCFGIGEDPADAGVYIQGRPFLANLSTHALTEMAKGNCGEPKEVIREAQRIIAQRTIHPQ